MVGTKLSKKEMLSPDLWNKVCKDGAFFKHLEHLGSSDPGEGECRLRCQLYSEADTLLRRDEKAQELLSRYVKSDSKMYMQEVSEG